MARWRSWEEVVAEVVETNPQIAGAFIMDDEFNLVFADGLTLTLKDAGQDCCEKRYMTCDDDLDSFIGAFLLGVEGREVSEDTGYDRHDMMFVKVKTNLGDITLVNHNEHNGYYGGFGIHADLIAVGG